MALDGWNLAMLRNAFRVHLDATLGRLPYPIRNSLSLRRQLAVWAFFLSDGWFAPIIYAERWSLHGSVSTPW